jgi:hypothetical protein
MIMGGENDRVIQITASRVPAHCNLALVALSLSVRTQPLSVLVVPVGRLATAFG